MYNLYNDTPTLTAIHTGMAIARQLSFRSLTIPKRTTPMESTEEPQQEQHHHLVSVVISLHAIELVLILCIAYNHDCCYLLPSIQE